MKGLNPTDTIPCQIPVGQWVAPDITTGFERLPRVEVFNEGDGNWLIRSSFNRDRVLRLSTGEVKQLVGISLFAQVQPAPELVR